MVSGGGGRARPNAKAKPRGAASGSARTARSRRDAGNPGYAGYEYQVEVTVWVALDLMLGRRVSDHIVVEPPSDEDLEAAVADPRRASLHLDVGTGGFDLVLQSKTRTGAPWTTVAIADILLGKGGHAGKGRRRPLDMLEEDQRKRYVLVTNEAIAEALRPHGGDHLFDFTDADDLPPHSRAGRDLATRASLAPRLLLLAGVTREVLAARIAKLLTLHGHVPPSKQDECVRDMREAARARMKGFDGGRWTRSDIVDVLARSGGSVAPTRDMDHFVRPRSFERIRARLDEAHVVVIVGPSGTGKTLTADVIEFELRTRSPAFEVVGEEDGPGHVRRNLTRADPVLFHLRDPWGGNRLTPGSDRWSGEISKLLASAGPSRKFLITSRSDVIQSAGPALAKDLRPYMVEIGIDDYDPERLGDIYDAVASDLPDHARHSAAEHRVVALRRLGRPYEISRFLIALGRADAAGRRTIDALLADSQVEAISEVVARQISPLGRDGVESAAIVWAMLRARGAVTPATLAQLVRRLRGIDPHLRPDVDGLVAFLVAGRNLRQTGPTLSFQHPRVEEGLRMAFEASRMDAEHALSKVVDVLLDWDGNGGDWGAETGLGVLRAAASIGGLNLDPSAQSVEGLHRHLDAVATSAVDRSDFEGALRDLARFASDEHVPGRLARMLIDGAPRSQDPWLRNLWRAPEIDDATMATLRGDGRIAPLVRRFVREVLPATGRDYHPDLIPLLHGIVPDLRDDFRAALDAVVDRGGFSENVDVIVHGLASGLDPDHAHVAAVLARAEAEADAWMAENAEALYEAEEHCLDAGHADHVSDEPAERYQTARTGMEELVRVRRRREGVAWIADDPHRLASATALATLLDHDPEGATLEDLLILLGQPEDHLRHSAWRAARRRWHGEVGAILMNELVRPDIVAASHRRTLIEVLATRASVDPVRDLTAVSLRSSPARRLQITQDLCSMELPGDTEDGDAPRARAHRLLEAFPEDERDLGLALVAILGGAEIRTTGAALSARGLEALRSVLPSAAVDLTGPLAVLAAAAGSPVEAAVDRLLSTGDPQDGAAAVQALVIGAGEGWRDGLLRALAHRRYHVRRSALEALVPDATNPERRRLVTVATDHGADVRLSFARLMRVHRWPEAVHALAGLLGDRRDFASHSPMAVRPRYRVAAAAARALGAYDALPGTAVEALFAAARDGADDPYVAHAAMAALAPRDDDRIVPLLGDALGIGTTVSGAGDRGRARAAAWALLDRVNEGLLQAPPQSVVREAELGDAAVAAPLLIAVGIRADEQREGLLRRLRDNGQLRRVRLVQISAIAAGAIDGLSLDADERDLARLANGEDIDEARRTDLLAWSRSLNAEDPFDRTIAWIAQQAFALPSGAPIGDVRAPDPPRDIKVFTMRSLTPYGEEEGSDED